MERKILKGSRDPDHAPFRDGLSPTGWDMISQSTKFEVPNFTCYGNMKGVAKCKKWGGVVRSHPRSLKIAPFDREHRSSY